MKGKRSMKRRLLALVLGICMIISLLAGCKGASGTSDSGKGVKMEPKETDVYLNSPVPIPIKLNLYFNNGGDVPYVSLEEWNEFYTMIMSSDEGDELKITFEKDGDKASLKRDFGDDIVYPMDFDVAEDTIHMTDYNVFFAEGKGTSLIHMFGMDEGYVKAAEGSNEIAGDEITFDLASYGIDMVRDGDNYYVPFQTIADIFCSQQPFTMVYNGEAVFAATGDTINGDDGLTELGKKYYSVPEGERSEELASFTYNELCFVMDQFYGLKENHGIESFDKLFDNNGYKEILSGTDPKMADAVLYRAIHYIINDQHSTFLSASPKSGADYTDELKKELGQGPCREETITIREALSSVSKKYYPDGVPGYEEIGNTAYITFNDFSAPSRNYAEEPATEKDRDTVGIISYSLGRILRKNSPVKNVVLDLSQNGGGTATVAAYVLSAFLGDANFSVRDTLTNATGTYVYKADTNFDGKYDENDTLAGKGLSIYCLTSKVSFSCGNLVPSVFKQTGDIALIGHRTGGGACAVMHMAAADGSFFRTSSNMQLSFMRNGSFYDVDQGVDPDYYIHDLGSLYDRQNLTAYINSLK